jgi:hypothetical protein
VSPFAGDGSRLDDILKTNDCLISTVRELLAPPGDPALFDALKGLRSAGGTAYKNSTRAAIDAITLSVKNPAVTQTIIVFLSDGSENNPAKICGRQGHLVLRLVERERIRNVRIESCTVEHFHSRYR